MAQSSALREQPSMDEILASIRRIIDAGEGKKTNAPAAAPRRSAEVNGRADRLEPRRVEPTAPPRPANDPRGKVAALPQTPLRTEPQKPTRPDVRPVAEEQPKRSAMFETDVLTAVDDYLRMEHVGEARGAAQRTNAAPEQQIPELEAALEAEFGGVDRAMMREERPRDARFTPDDNNAFKEVGSVLRGTVEGLTAQPQRPAEPQQASQEQVRARAEQPEPARFDSLVSDAVAKSVSHSFTDLASMLGSKTERSLDEIAEEMMRPMLQEWLDNNLPTIVERLVRTEIERIARGG